MQRAEWLRLLEAEQARRTTKQAWQAAAGERAREQFLDQIIGMGERLLAGGEQIFAILEELVGAEGDRECIDAIRDRADMSMAEACALILMKTPRWPSSCNSAGVKRRTRRECRTKFRHRVSFPFYYLNGKVGPR